MLAVLVFCLGLLFTVHSKAQESDPRLQANGPGWRVECAKRDNDKLPRVLLIGDSILNGYMNGVIRGLRGIAYVDAWVNPYHQANGGLTKMTQGVLVNGPYDVIHFNMGLHGWRPGQFKEGEFESSQRRWAEVLQGGSPKTKLIWASSTPVTTKRPAPFTLDPEINPVIVEQNRMAAEVMKSMNIPVNDFYGMLVDHLDWAAGDQFHWTAPVSDLLAKAVVRSLAGPLGMDQKTLDAALARVDEPEFTKATFRLDFRANGGPARMEFQSGDEKVEGTLPAWGGEQGTYLMVKGSIGKAWQKFTFTFMPKVSGRVALCIKCDTGKMFKPIWVAYDNFTVAGATLTNGDFESLDRQGKLEGWTCAPDVELKSGAAPSGQNFVKVLTEGGLYQDFAVEAGNPVTVSFQARIANGMESGK